MARTRLWGKRLGWQLMLVALLLSIIASFVPQKAAAQTVSGINGRIAYITDTNPGKIRTLNHNANNIDNKIYKEDDVTPYYNVQYSPDGTKVAYLDAAAPTTLYIDYLDGTNITTLNDGRFYGSFSWAPDGSKLLVTAQNGTAFFNIYSMNVDGSNFSQLTNYTQTVFNPRYSPDMTKIIYETSTEDQVFIMNANGTNAVNLTGSAHDAATFPAWSPSGNKIIYTFDDGSGFYQIGTMNPDGSGKVIVPSALTGGPAIYSPDGNYIAYIDTSENLHIMNANGSNDAIWASDAATMAWQSMRFGPISTNVNPTLNLTNGTASVNIPSLFSDPYGNGINPASVVVVTNGTKGTATADPITGIITYRLTTTASNNPSFWTNLSSFFFPKVSAAASDSFTYRVCSNGSASLCTTGTVTIAGIATLADTGQNQHLFMSVSLGLIVAGVVLIVRLRRKHANLV